MKFFNSTLVGLSVAAVASLTLGIEGASAQLSVVDASCSVANLTGTTDCEGVYSGNDSNSISTSTELFGKTGWSELWKVDDSSGTAGPLTVALNNAGDNTSGTWTLSDDFDFGDYGDIMFALKGGPTFTAYLSDGQTRSGTWNTDDLRNGGGRVGPGLSHFTVWTTGTGSGGNGEPPASVPEPAALLGLGSVVLGSRFLRRKSEDA